MPSPRPQQRQTTTEDVTENRMPSKSTAITCVVAISLAVGLYVYFRQGLSARLEQRFHEIRRQGQPLYPADLTLLYPEVAGDNAATYVHQALDQYAGTSLQFRWSPIYLSLVFPDKTSPISSGEMKGLAAFLAKNSTALDLLRRAARAEGCFYESLELESPVGPRWRFQRRMHALFNLLITQGIYDSEQGRPHLSTVALLDALSLIKTVGDQPSIYSQRAYASETIEALRGLEWLLNKHAPDERDLADLQRAVSDAENLEGLQRGYTALRTLGPRYHALALRQQRMTGIFRGDFASVQVFFHWASGNADRDLIFFLDLMGRFIEMAGRPSHERIAMFRALEAESRTIPNVLLGSSTYFPSIPHPIIAHANMVALLHASQVALAVESFRRAHHRTPDSIEELVPEYLGERPIDPYSDDAMLYLRLQKGYLIYSVGKDGVDDGGKRSAGIIAVENTLPDLSAHRTSRLRVPSHRDIAFYVGR